MTVTYPEVGATREGPLPPGYLHVTRRVRVGQGHEAFAAAAAALARWQPQRGAGLRLRSDADRVTLGGRFSTGIGVGPLRLWVPCLIVWVIDEPERYGFGFGTLPGHVETGEESFRLTVEPGGEVWFEIRAFSRPATWWVRLGNPVAKLVQARVTDRYAKAMQKAPLP